MQHSFSEEPSLELSPALVRFIEDIALFYEAYGIARIGGRIFGLFLVTTTPLSAEQIAHLLKASRSSVSTNVRALLANGWIEKVTFPGDRTEYYRFSPSAWERVMERRKQGIEPLKALAEQARAALPADHQARDQLDQMAEWAEVQLEHYNCLLAAWRARLVERKLRKQEAGGKEPPEA